MNDATLIRLENADCSFLLRRNRLSMRRVDALSDINLTLRRGEILGVIGHNGAGKSTLLRVLAGILTPRRGRMHKAPGLTSTLLSLSLGFAAELTGRENAVLGSMYLGLSRKQAEARLEAILDFAELDSWADAPLRTYSTGMGARLAFAVAMTVSPDIMLVDETLGVGDAYFQQKSQNALMEKMRNGQTSVLVAHNAALMASLCTRLIWLHKGRIRMEGDPTAVQEAYMTWSAERKPGTVAGE